MTTEKPKRTIHKFIIDEDTSILNLPQGAKVLDLAVQADSLYLWVEVPTDPKTSLEPFHLALVYTGEDVPTGLKYAKTYHWAAKDLVLHLYIQEDRTQNTIGIAPSSTTPHPSTPPAPAPKYSLLALRQRGFLKAENGIVTPAKGYELEYHGDPITYYDISEALRDPRIYLQDGTEDTVAEIPSEDHPLPRNALRVFKRSEVIVWDGQ